MYGQLDYKSDRVEAPWTVSYFQWRDLVPPNLSPAQATARGKTLGQLKHEVPDVTDVEVSRLMAIARGLPGGQTDQRDPVSDLHLALAHLRLPEAARKAREARIASTMAAHFDGGVTLPALAASLQHIRLLAPLAPDAFLEPMVRSQVARLQMVSIAQPAWTAQCSKLLTRLESLTGELGVEPRSPDDALVISACFTRAWADRQAFLELLDFVAQKQLGGAVRGTQKALLHAGLLEASEGDILLSVLLDCQATGLDGSMPTAIDQIVTNQVAIGRAADNARAQAVVEASIEATLTGVPLGTRVQQQNMAAISAAGQVWMRQSLRMTPQRLRQHNPQARAPSTASPQDLDPVSSWSVNRLLRWIEGPISEGAPQRLDRKAIATREKTARQEARVKTNMPAKTANTDLDLTEADVDLAVQTALSTTAGFFIGDIEDMLFRAKALDSASAAVQACTDLLAALRALRDAPALDDQKARALLHQAEVAIDALRKDIRVREADVRTRQRFAQQLQAALARETMAEGKRHGGVINCPLHRADWPWVAEQYHRRWLPWIGQITIDGVLQPLQPDQALGLYVTGKSLSGHEFDVSVHLWQRKPGRHSAAGTRLAPYAPMNTDDWTDTLIPCTVLHVPSAG